MKRAFAAIAAIFFIMTMSSCETPYTAAAVSSSELGDYSGNPASSEAEAKVAVTAGFESGAVPVGQFSVAGDSSGTLARAFPGLLGSYEAEGAEAASRSVSYAATTNPDGSIAYAWSGSNEVVSSNPTVYLSGSLAYTLSAALSDAASVDVDASFAADLDADVGAYAASGLNGGVMHLKAAGSSAVSGTLFNYTASGEVNVAMNAGFSLSETTEHKGGKYIVSLRYRADYSESLSTVTDLAGGLAAGIDMYVYVSVYGNDDRLIDTYTFTAADFASVAF